MFAWLKRRRAESSAPEADRVGRGIMVFEQTGEVIRAENLLRDQGWAVRVMGPPPEIRTGCDLVIEFPLMEELHLVRELTAAGIAPLQVVPVSGPLLAPVDLYQTTDFGDYLMVRAANMKITVAKGDRRIVNVSGGGCPDVPWLAHCLCGMRLDEAPEPRSLGQTLCCYSLQKAYEELRRQYPCGI